MQHTIARVATFQHIGIGCLPVNPPSKLFRGLSDRRPALQSHAGIATRMSYCGFKFEVFGKVQGVFFRACTAEEAQKLGVVGWVRNAPSGSVAGEAQGPKSQLDTFRDWLEHKGSPASRIDRCVISDERHDLGEPAFSSFEVRR